MIILRRNCLRNTPFVLLPSLSPANRVSRDCSSIFSPISSFSMVESVQSVKNMLGYQDHQSRYSTLESYISFLSSKVRVGSNEDEVVQSLLHDNFCCSIQISDNLVDKLLCKFEDDWKSALGLFRWAGTRPGYKNTPEAYDKMVNILGKAKQMDRMWLLVDEMHKLNNVTLTTIAKIMRRLAGADRWKDVIKTFDDLGTYGLEKDTQSMNLLLDTLCKEGKVELARDVFLELKTHISPDAYTFNIFIYGWCKVNRVDEAHWTIQEMKGYGYRPSTISYSTIIQAYCNQSNFRKVYELLDEMEVQGCPPNVVTYTTFMYSLAKSDEFDEALQIYERMKSAGCRPDTLFYNSLIHILGRAGRLHKAVHIYELEMAMNGITPNLSTYNTMIAMYCRHSQEQNALNVLKDIEKSTFCKPDLRTYNPLLKLCFKTGKTDSNLNGLLDDMINKHHLSLDLSTYSLLLHGLCRANKCERAYIIFEEMISQEITPRYKTCRLLVDELKQKNMNDHADRVEDVMKQMKTSAVP